MPTGVANSIGVSVVARLVAALAVTAALGLVFGIETEMEQRVVVLARDHHHVTAAPAVAAARTAARDKLLAPERKTAVAAVAGFDGNDDFVYEQALEASAPVQSRRP